MHKALFALLVSIEKRWFWPLFGLICLTTILWVFQLSDKGVEFHFALAQGLFYSLQFIVLNKEVDTNAASWIVFGLTFTQFALPLLASSVVLGGLFREQIRPIWVRKYATSGLKDHHIVIGYGDLGKALVSQLVVSKKHVVAIDIREHDRQQSDCLIILQGDACLSVDDLFSGSQLKKASCLYLVLPDENENLRVLERLQECFKANEGVKSLKVYLRTETHAFGQLFTDWVGLNSTHGQTGFDVRPINPYDVVARGVVNEYSPDLYAPTDHEGGIAQTIVILGTSQMAQSLILRFARVGIYSASGKLRILWVGDDVGEVAESLIGDFPFLDAQSYPKNFWGADVTTSPWFYTLNLPSVELITMQGRAETLVRSGTMFDHFGDQCPAAIYVCHGSDARNIKDARDLQSALGADFAPDSHSQRLILALQNQAKLGVRAQDVSMRYKISEESIDQKFASTLVSDKVDALAERFKHAYDVGGGYPHKAWSTLSFFEKESNRDAADHCAIKARYAGLDAELVRVAMSENPVGIPEAEIKMEAMKEALYLMEQRRYRAFMFMQGFRHMVDHAIPEQCKKDAERTLRINTTLLEKNLTDAELDKDTNIVRITAQVLTGYASREHKGS